MVPAPRPNLFTYATSELSQDAFLCWLLAWAAPEQRSHDPHLHAVGRAFLAALFDKCGIPEPELGTPIQVHRQLKAADVVAEVGSEYLLVIEDKTHTKNHSDQLNRYRNLLSQQFPDRLLVLIYLKTGDQSSYGDVVSKGWMAFTRGDLLGIMRQGQGIQHDVFLDFLHHMEQVEEQVNRHATAPPDTWTSRDPAYRGMFLALQEARVEGEWSFVNNAKGGFLCFWWGAKLIDGGQLALQIEEHQLVIKIGIEEAAKRRSSRDHWCQVITQGLPDFRRPRRLGYGRWMAVATFDGDYRIVGADGLLDLAAVLVLVRRLEIGVHELIAVN